MGTRVSRPVWIVVATLVIALGVGATSTAVFAGLNPAFKIAVHVKIHPTSCTKGYPTFTTPASITTTYAGTGDIDLMPVFYNLVGFKLNETGLIWPEAAWGSASWVKCKGDVAVGGISHSADNTVENPQTRGAAIAWATCQTAWASAPGYAWVTATGAGRVVPAPNPAVDDFGVTDCSAEAAYDYPIAIYGAGIGGTAGDNPAADPVCNVNPLSLDFGTVLLGGWEQRTFTITNTGDATMTGRVKVACVDTTTFKIVAGGGIYYLTHNQFVNVTVQFKPSAVGTQNCTIETGAGICGDVSCVGVGDIPPACTVNPTSLNFNLVSVGDSLDKTFTIKNTGGGSLSGTVSEACGDYSIASGGGAYNLTAGQQVTVTIRFKPTSAGLKTCAISTGASCSQVNCQGTGEQTIVPLVISKDDAIASTACAFPGGGVTYTLSYNNPNTSSVTNVVVTDYLAADVDFGSATGGGTYVPAGHKVVWNLGTLAAATGGSVDVVTTVKLTASPSVALLDSCAIVSTETPTPATASHTTAVCACAISGPALVCPASTSGFCGPGGMTSYAWSVTGGGTITGPSDAQCVNVVATSSCAAAYTVILDLVQPGNVHSHCEKLVVVDDIVPPEITFCPAAIAVQCVGDVPAANPALVTATDNCGAVNVTHVGDVSDGHTCPEVITRTYRATDLCGNHVDCQQTITINDTTNPQITFCPGAIAVQCAGDVPAANPALVTATDNCSAVTVTHVGDVSDGHTCPEVITRTYRATDLCGNHVDCQQTITIHDTQVPQITFCPHDTTVQCATDVPAANPALVTATDNCGAVNVTHVSDAWGLAHTPLGGVVCQQTVTRTYRATDLCGNSADCIQIITVRDTVKPQVQCPADQVIECDAAINWGTPTVTDNCDPSPVVSHVDSTYAGACPHNYQLVRNWTATDFCGNEGGCRQTITVQDSHAPVVHSGPPDTTVACATEVPAPDTNRIDATDNCGAVTVEWVSDLPSGPSCNRTIARTYRVTDECGLHADYTQHIYVVDGVRPTITCAADERVACGSPINFTDPTASDNCDPAPVVIVVSTTTTNGPGSGEVTHTRTWSATDNCSNSAQCSQSIIEEACACSIAGADAVCPSSGHEYCGPIGMTSYDWSITGDGSITSADDQWCVDVLAASTCSGSFTLTLVLNGGTAQCQKTVAVRDVTGPQITSCPPAGEFQCETDVPAPDPNLVTATDNCSAVTVAWVSDVPSGTCPKTITRTYRASDACGNHTDCVQLITVRDTEAPRLSCAADGQIACGDPVVFTDPTATDNCDPSPIVQVESTTTNPGPGPGEYTHTRCWTAVDVCGNLSLPCCQNIVETACPTLPLTLTKDDGISGSVAPGDPIDYTLVCGNPNAPAVTGLVIKDQLPSQTNFVSASNGGTYNSGTHEVTWTLGALDGGETATVHLIVDVDPATPPSFIINTCTAESDQTGTSTAAETTHVEIPVVQAYIDIKPTACPNPLNINARGVLPVAILGTADVNVSQIDRTSIRLTRQGWPGEIAPVNTSLADVATPFLGALCGCSLGGADGEMDLVANFALRPLVQALGLNSVKGQTVTLTLTAVLNTGGSPTRTLATIKTVVGSDCIMVTSGTGRDEIWIMESRSVVSAGSQARFSFSLAESDHVRVEVFDVHGRLVESLMDSDLGAGSYSVDWNITDGTGQRVPIGIYFVRLSTRTEDSTKKIVVVE